MMEERKNKNKVSQSKKWMRKETIGTLQDGKKNKKYHDKGIKRISANNKSFILQSSYDGRVL